MDHYLSRVKSLERLIAASNAVEMLVVESKRTTARFQRGYNWNS